MPRTPTIKQVLDARLNLSCAYNFASALSFMEDLVGPVFLTTHIETVVKELRAAAACLGYELKEIEATVIPEHETRQ